jgi:thioredoxin reductase
VSEQRAEIKSEKYDVMVIGAGAAGMAAALKLAEAGKQVVLIDRDNEYGGVLNQCIHNGFGLHYFKRELTGPEFAERMSAKVHSSSMRSYVNMSITDLIHSTDGSGSVEAYGISEETGLIHFYCKALVLALGCRERNRGNIAIPGSRPAGVFTAGLAQRLVNLEGLMPGKEVVIVGSGDIGLIMARRMTLVGARVKAVIEIMPYPSGLTRNVVQCLKDYGIPLYLSHSVTKIYGKNRIEAVDVSPLEDGIIREDKKFTIDCDTLLLSVGLVPEQELAKQLNLDIDTVTGGPYVDDLYMSSLPGVFACGNALHVHDLVDWAASEGESCAIGVIDFLNGKLSKRTSRFDSGKNVRYVVPKHTQEGKETLLSLRSLVVANDVVLKVKQKDEVIFSKKLKHIQPSEMIQFKLIPAKGAMEVHLETAD